MPSTKPRLLHIGHIATESYYPPSEDFLYDRNFLSLNFRACQFPGTWMFLPFWKLSELFEVRHIYGNFCMDYTTGHDWWIQINPASPFMKLGKRVSLPVPNYIFGFSGNYFDINMAFQKPLHEQPQIQLKGACYEEQKILFGSIDSRPCRWHNGKCHYLATIKLWVHDAQS